MVVLIMSLLRSFTISLLVPYAIVFVFAGMVALVTEASISLLAAFATFVLEVPFAIMSVFAPTVELLTEKTVFPVVLFAAFVLVVLFAVMLVFEILLVQIATMTLLR